MATKTNNPMPMTAHPPQIQGLFDNPVALETMLDEIPMAILVIDCQRRIVHMNRASSALTGYSLQEARGIACHNIVRSQICIKDCPVERLEKDSEPFCIQTDLINRDRELVPVRITFAPVIDSKGRITGFLETLEDIRAMQGRGGDITRAFGFSEMIGKSPEMEKVFRMLPLIAQNDSSVLITGETGTGKDLVAEAIHETSNRARGPFIKINCGALPETLLESELFGHQKGAFTGAVENKPGRFRLAHNGSLYLTEIGDLPLALQVKLLTFLDDRVIYPLGSTKGFEVNVRVIAGTHQDLETMVREGKFRKDLLFRLNVVRVQLPPLRARDDDIRLLMDHFMKTFAQDFGKTIEGFSKNALELLKGYGYPGNVRELRNIIEYAVNVGQGPLIKIDDLPAYLTESPAVPAPAPEKAAPAEAGAFPQNPAGFQGRDTWPETEKQLIINALVQAAGKRQKAAEILGWGRSTLWRKIKQYGIG
ncbi:MAG: sigma-54 interaction domain-containing protein [Thermodesulfobacteriota bacterium]